MSAGTGARRTMATDRGFAAALVAVTAVLLAGSASAELAPLVTGLVAPIAFVDPPDGLAHRFIGQQRGDVVVRDGASAGPLPTPFLDLRDDASVPVAQRKILFGGERGLLSMAVDPGYRDNGRFFVFYTSRDWDGPGGIAAGDLVVERYLRDPTDPDRADPSSGQLVLAVPHAAAANHNGGDLRFGPDGFLYVSVGDGGGGCDTVAHSGQDVDQLLGKVLRIDVAGADAYPEDPLRNHAIPASNPLVGLPGADEIWALGLRNPFRLSFDRTTGDLYLGDVGQDDWEEIDRIPAGAVTAGAPVNFGWPCLEGFVDSECAAPPQGCAGSFTAPVRVEPNSTGTWRAIIGGYVYRGVALAELGGKYLYGDAGNGEIWVATRTDGPPPGWPAELLASGIGSYGFGEDERGELYVLSAWTGALLCMQPEGGDCTEWAASEDVFSDGFESGDTSRWSFSTP